MKIPNINNLVKEKLTEDARKNMIAYFKYHGVEEDAWFYENIYTALPTELRGRVNESCNEVGTLGQRDRYLPREILETKETYKLFQEVIDGLMSEQGHLSYANEDGLWRDCDRTEEHIELIRKRIRDDKSDWKLQLQF